MLLLLLVPCCRRFLGEEAYNRILDKINRNLPEEKKVGGGILKDVGYENNKNDMVAMWRTGG